ncbi:MAG: hypothetical protein JSW67_03270 [Candidatus Latescibacterota bacterium]|nr:MAG: hypothetical protein JSW67_03270 [Candidatus Latescibacterota bacterium]
MKSHFIVLAAGMLSALLLASQASAQSCGTNDFVLASDTGTPQGLMTVGKAGYVGFILGGNMAPGNWSMMFDESAWPTNSAERRDYLKSMYTYDGNGSFVATFADVSMHLEGAELAFDGTATVMLRVADGNGNGKLDGNEFDQPHTLLAAIDMSCGSGTPLCGGRGDANGGVDIDTVVTSAITGSLNTQSCATAVKDTPWTNVKSLFRD